jgi:hypothetical protein
MVQVFFGIVAFMAAHRKKRDLAWDLAVRISVNHSHLIPVVKRIGLIVSKSRFNTAVLVNDAVINHFLAGGRLKVHTALFASVGASKNVR